MTPQRQAYLTGDHEAILAELFDAPLARFAPVYGKQPYQTMHIAWVFAVVVWFWYCALNLPDWYVSMVCTNAPEVCAKLGQTIGRDIYSQLVAAAWAVCTTCVLAAYGFSLKLKAEKRVDPFVKEAARLGTEEIEELDSFAWWVSLLAPWIHIPVFVLAPLLMWCLGLSQIDVTWWVVVFPAGLTLSPVLCSYGMVLVMWKVTMLQTKDFLSKMTVLRPADDQVGGLHHSWGNTPSTPLLDGSKNPESAEYWQTLATHFQTLHRSMVTSWKSTAKPLYSIMAAFSFCAFANILLGLQLHSKALRAAALMWAGCVAFLTIALLAPMARTTQLFQAGSSKSVKFIAAQYVGFVPEEALQRYMAFMQNVQCTDSGVNLWLFGIVSWDKLVRATVALCTFLPTALSISSGWHHVAGNPTYMGNATSMGNATFVAI